MKIWCANNKEVQVTLKQLWKRGCRWRGGEELEYYMNKDCMTIFIEDKVLTFSRNRVIDATSASQLYANLLR